MTIGQLYRLQQIDSEWDEASELMAEVKQSLDTSDELLQAREAAAAAERELNGTKAKLRSLELEVGSLDARFKANQERMYGGKVRNPKELTGLAEEAKSLKRQRAELEDAELEQMVLAESQEEALKDKRAQLRQIEAQFLELHSVLLAESERLTARLEELDEQRAEVRSRIARTDQLLYDDLRGRLGGVAVALLRHGMCQACGVDVPTAEAQAVERGVTHFCPVCNRLLCGGG